MSSEEPASGVFYPIQQSAAWCQLGAKLSHTRKNQEHLRLLQILVFVTGWFF